MKHIIFFLYVNFLGVLSLVGGKAVAQVTEQRAISINTPHSSLVYEAKAGQPLRFVYYGEKISQGDVEELLKGKCPDAFPAYGKNDHGETALSVVHSDGSRVSDLVVETVSADAIVLKDTYYNLSVTLHFKTYSDNDIIETWTEVKNGEKGGSRQFHRWGRKYQLANGERERKVLLNSWEGVYFGINEERMHAMMDDAAAMGCELFVMDDGWFGNKYRRNDTQGLGDWMVDTGKLPGGLTALCRFAAEKGISFGIWIEPEAVNTKSELFEKHPDWALKPMHHEPLTGRGGTQLTLDMSNPRVQDFVFNMFDTLLTRYTDIDYIKWDANAAFLNHEVSNIAYHQGLVQTLQRIRAKFPNVTIQDCASGGGRVNWGYLPYFDECWTSDNTDAMQRLRIQWGTSLFFPAICMASHISASPNHQTFRSVPLKFRIDVAMAGRLGMEIQPKDMTEAEKEQCKRAIEDYKTVRPVVQFGDLYRLSSPYEGEISALMYVSEDKQKSVCYWYKLSAYKDQHLPLLRLQGLDPEARYTIHELNALPGDSFPLEGKTFTGTFLMQHGVEMPQNHSIRNRNERMDYASRVFVISAK